jgi:CPA1 family monovalent cation:H+ antiporter
LPDLSLVTWGCPCSASASDRITLISFWEYAGFIVNTFIFLLIGIEINPLTLWQTLPSIVLVILAYQLGRILSVYSLLSVLRWIDSTDPLALATYSDFGQHQGFTLHRPVAVAIPLALTGRQLIIELVFGAVLFSLVIQGLALPWLIKRLNISQVSAVTRDIGQLQAAVDCVESGTR